MNTPSITMKALALAGLVLGTSGTAYAYVGPGAGLSLLGALWGLVIAVGVAAGFVLFWPLRQYRRRLEAQRQGASAQGPHPGAEGMSDRPRS
jgi:hypothetical protein